MSNPHSQRELNRIYHIKCTELIHLPCFAIIVQQKVQHNLCTKWFGVTLNRPTFAPFKTKRGNTKALNQYARMKIEFTNYEIG